MTYRTKLAPIVAIFFVVSLMACNNPSNPEQDETAAAKAQPNKLDSSYNLDKITLPAGFSISVYAEVPNARSMCWGEKGTLFVGNREGENVHAVVDSDNDGRADKVYKIGSGLKSPNGVAFRNGSLYVAEISRIIRYDNIEDQLANPPSPVVVYDKYPDKTHHGWKYIAFGPDDKLYVPVGAPCNVCNEKDSIFATITRMNPDGTDMEIYAKGVRNSVGFDWHPDTKELWFTDNGRDQLGDDQPFCELNYAPQKSMHFGFPFCHQGDILDPEFGKGKNCADYVTPARNLGPHIAPLGMHFYTGKSFPDEYKNQVFIPEHGSWNRSKPIGYQVSLAKLQGNKVVDYTPFATGWLQNDGTVLGRPVDIKIDKDGSLLVSDDFKGAIYRISYASGTKGS